MHRRPVPVPMYFCDFSYPIRWVESSDKVTETSPKKNPRFQSMVCRATVSV